MSAMETPASTANSADDRPCVATSQRQPPGPYCASVADVCGKHAEQGKRTGNVEPCDSRGTRRRDAAHRLSRGGGSRDTRGVKDPSAHS